MEDDVKPVEAGEDIPAGATVGIDSEGKARSTEVSNWVDKAMYSAEEFDDLALLAPKVFMLQISPDPLGGVAAMSMMYEGRVIRSLEEITDDERREYFDECFKTTLKAPLEAIDLHFMVEGITRAHSHQEVRQRTAVFAQESMRFAVKENIAARPGPLIRDNPRSKKRWDALMETIWENYQALIADGIPAEEARGVLPHDTLTRMHHKVNLRNLMDELGKRLCTQAQFDWKLWAASMRDAIRQYDARVQLGVGNDGGDYNWQFRYLADSPNLFVPICFNTGRCMFKAKQDRGCTIRERVERGAFDEIRTEEWALDPTAGWVR